MVKWAPFCSCWGGSQAVRSAIVREAMAPFVAKHPGIDLRYAAPSNDSWLPTALLAGAAPDLFSNSETTAGLSVYFNTGGLFDLRPLVQRDNVNLGVFPEQAVALARQGSTLLGLPQYIGTAAMVVNLGVLDALGLSYPESGWTHQEWGRLWQSVAMPGKRFATSIYWNGFEGGSLPAFYCHGWGGALLDPAGNAALSTPPDTAAAEWLLPWVRDGLALHSIWAPPAMWTAGQVVT